MNSDGAIGTITLVESFEAPLDCRKSITSKLVSAPALASFLQYIQLSYSFNKKHLKVKEKEKMKKKKVAIKLTGEAKALNLRQQTKQ